MHNSDTNTSEKNNRPKNIPVRVILSCLLFILFTGIITAVVYRPYGQIYSNSNQFELIVLGASEPLWGANPQILTDETGMKTCILASERCDYAGKYEMLHSAIQQDSLEMVLLDVSNTSLVKDFDPLKELYFTKVSGLFNKLGTAFRRFSFWEDEYDTIFAETLNSGIKSWGSVLNGSYDEIFQRHGYEPQYAATLTDAPEDIAAMRDFTDTDLDYDLTALDEIRKMAALCRSHNVEMIIVTFPVSAQSNWLFSGWDSFRGIMTSLAEELQVPYYDFNLLIDRYDYFPDATCFRDIEHLNSEGADRFSKMLAELVNCQKEGTAYPYGFYDSYLEAKDHSYYAQFQ